MMHPWYQFALMATFFVVTGAIVCLAVMTVRVRAHRKELSELLDEADDDKSESTMLRATPVPSGLAPRRLKVLSHNVWGHYFVGGPSVTARLDALAAHIQREGYDVVLVQELFIIYTTHTGPEMAMFLRFARQMRDIGLVYMTDPRVGAPRFLQNHGLGFFSRYPITHSTIRAFPSSAEPVNAKGVACVTVEVPVPDHAREADVTLFHFANFHPDSRNADSRGRQIEYVAEVMRQHLGRQSVAVGGVHARNIIIAGDANVCSKNQPEQYAFMTEKMARAGARTDLFPGHYTTRGGDRVVDPPTFISPPLWLDHMFVSDDLAPPKFTAVEMGAGSGSSSSGDAASAAAAGGAGASSSASGGSVVQLQTRPTKFVSREVRRFKTADGVEVSDHLGLEAVFSLE